MNEFMDCYEEIGIKWALNTLVDDSHTIEMQIITVTE